MQNAESYVALGRDNSGAAAIPRSSNPMTGAFSAHDAGILADKKRKGALLDSFGNDLKGISGQAWEVDFPELNQEMDKFLMMKADYMAKGVDLGKDKDAFMAISQQKQRVVDLAAKSKYDRQTYQNIAEDIRKNPHMYNQEDVKKFQEEWSNTTASKRDKNPGIQRIGQDNWIPAIQKAAGNVYKTTTTKVRQKDGTFKSVTSTTLDENALNERFDNYWDNNVLTGGDRNFQQFQTTSEDRSKAEAAAKGLSWEQLPLQTRADAVEAEARRQFALYSKADEKLRKSYGESGTVKEEDGNAGGKGIKIGKYTYDYYVDIGEDAATPLKGPVKYEVWSVSDPDASENKKQVWKTRDGEAIKGELQRIKKNTATGEMTLEIATYPETGYPVKASIEPVMEDVPFNKANKSKLDTQYGLDPFSFRDKYFSNWEQMLKDLDGNEEAPIKTSYGVGQGTAISARRGNTAETTPAAPKSNLKNLPGVVKVR